MATTHVTLIVSSPSPIRSSLTSLLTTRQIVFNDGVRIAKGITNAPSVRVSLLLNPSIRRTCHHLRAEHLRRHQFPMMRPHSICVLHCLKATYCLSSRRGPSILILTGRKSLIVSRTRVLTQSIGLGQMEKRSNAFSRQAPFALSSSRIFPMTE